MQVSKSTIILVAILILGLVAALAYQLGKGSDDVQIARSAEPTVSSTPSSEVGPTDAKNEEALTPPLSPKQTPKNGAGPFNASELALIEADRSADETCRGGDPSPETDAACERRDKTLNTLNAAGICWGRDGEAYVEHEYHRCGPSSLR